MSKPVILLVACTTKAFPLQRAGGTCEQSAGSGNINLGSSTNIAPVIQVRSIIRYQPGVKMNAPIVQSDCAGAFSKGLDCLDHGGYMVHYCGGRGPVMDVIIGMDMSRD
ncbi:hypothetical protein EDD11_006237 [Mortierella claussenii]|nr:hypothetical protein EDD11_006237 [Mortierella claussenii]